MVEDDSFKELGGDIINLSLARNAISTIFLFAFAPLKKITFLDLSDNRLEYFSSELFESNEKLTSLDISKNKFMFLPDEPLIKSKSLEFLSLQNSHLSHLYPSFFSHLPNILNLDLSNNLLITVSSDTFKETSILHSVNLEYNRFSCAKELEKTLEYLRKRKVVVKIDRCVGPSSKKPMFEKMILLPTVTAPPEDIDIEVVWGKKLETVRSNRSSNNVTRYYESIIEDEYSQECKKSKAEESDLCECFQNFVNLYELKNQTNQNLKRHMETRIFVVFHLGLFLGVLFGTVCYYCINFIIKKCKNIQKKTVELQRRRDEVTRTHQVQEIRLAEHSSPRNSPISSLRNNRNENIDIIRNIQRQRVQQPVQRHIIVETGESSYRPSSTAQLINKLFGNREPRVVSHSEERPLSVRATALEFPQPSTSSSAIDNVSENNIQTNHVDNINEDDSIETETVRSSTPPPPYLSIFD